MPKAIAIALHRSPAILTLKSYTQRLTDLMYGTPERTQLTLWFAGALLLMAVLLPNANAMQVCVNQ